MMTMIMMMMLLMMMMMMMIMKRTRSRMSMFASRILENKPKGEGQKGCSTLYGPGNRK